MPIEEVAEIKEMFDIMDTDKNGNLTLEELKEGFQFIGSPVIEPDVQMLLEAVINYSLFIYYIYMHVYMAIMDCFINLSINFSVHGT